MSSQSSTRDAQQASLDRREFAIQSGRRALGVALAASVLTAGKSLAADAATDAVDAHVHVWTKDTTKYPISQDFKVADMVPPSFTPEELFEHTKPAGVSRVVLIQMSFYKYDNRYMLDSMERFPGVFAGVGIVDENDGRTPKLMKELKAKGVLGFRLYTDKSKAEAWSQSAGMKAMWSTAADTGQSMCLLANPDALPIVDKMIEQYPRTRVVIDHFARIGMTGTIDSAALDTLCRLARYPNVFVKTSAFYALGSKRAPYTDLVPMIMRLVKEFGAQRLMWASDCPYQVQGDHTYKASIDLVRNQLPELSSQQRSAILRDTALDVFFARS